MVKMMVVVVLVFTICWAPFNILLVSIFIIYGRPAVDKAAGAYNERASELFRTRT